MLDHNKKKNFESVKEIESEISGVPIDIEFAVDKNNKFIFFRIRILFLPHKIGIFQIVNFVHHC